MQGATLLLIGLLNVGVVDYNRSFESKKLDQATLDAEGYGEKKAFQRDARGLHIKLQAGEKETGWKTPQNLRIGGNFTISASVDIEKLPKPAQEDGVAIGIAVAFQNADQPDATLIRVVEPKGADVYRWIHKAGNMPGQPMMMGMMMPFQQPGAKPEKPPRPTFPASGKTIRFEIQREGNTLLFQVVDGKADKPRYLGQAQLGQNDVAAVKLFVSNRNGAEAINVLLRDLTIRADRFNGLGTTVRNVYGEIVYGDPTSIEKNILIVGGEPKNPPQPKQDNAAKKPGDAAKSKAGAPTKDASKLADASKKDASKPVDTSKKDAPKPADASKKDASKPAETPKAADAKQGAAAKPTTTAAKAAQPAKAATEPAKNAQGQAKPATPPKPKEPKAKIPLDEVESIHFERTPAIAGRFLGQPNLDLTGPPPGAEKKDDSAPKTDAKTDGAKPKDDAKKDEAKRKDEAKKDGSKPKDEAKKDASQPKDEAKKDDSKPKDAAKKDESKPKAQAKKDAAKPKADAKKAAADDVLAPPPGTAETVKIAKVNPKPNGIRDLHLSVANLPAAEIKQVTVSCQTDKGQTSWRLDTTDSHDWPLVVRRAATEPWADLFLEPPPGDCHGKPFTVNLTFANGQNSNTNINADQHSDAKKAVDPKAPAPPILDAMVTLIGEEKLFGKLEALTEEKLRLTTPRQEHIDLPLGRVAGVHVGLANRKETAASFAKRLKTPSSEDVLLAQTKDGEVLAISGIVEGIDGEKLRFRYQEKIRTLPLKQVEGWILAARPAPKSTDENSALFTLPGGIVVAGRLKDINTAAWKIQASWGQELELPASEILAVRFRGGKMTRLSDLSPVKVDEAPFFGRRFPWRKDTNLLGEPLKMDGRTYDHGLAVHSRCALTYEINGRFATFETLLGFDDAAGRKGRVACRVLADGKELYTNPDLRADGPPVKLALPVAGAEQLQLIVDFGKGQDTGDRVIWADARLYRNSTNAAHASAAGSR